MENNIMAVEKVLPEDFDGTFRFTNWTDEDFIGKWNSKEYAFPAQTTSPIIMLDATPIEIQNIRKKFAKDLAEREFGKSQVYKDFLKRERNVDGSPRGYGMSGAASYSLNELTPYIQRCLEPLPEGKVSVTAVNKVNIEDRLSRDDEGKINTKPVRKNASMTDLAKSFEQP